MSTDEENFSENVFIMFYPKIEQLFPLLQHIVRYRGSFAADHDAVIAFAPTTSLL